MRAKYERIRYRQGIHRGTAMSQLAIDSEYLEFQRLSIVDILTRYPSYPNRTMLLKLERLLSIIVSSLDSGQDVTLVKAAAPNYKEYLP